MSEYPEDVMKAAYAVGCEIRYYLATAKEADPINHDASIDAIIARALMAEREKWRDISTAPKDGTEFLAYDVRTGKMDVCYIISRRVEIVNHNPEWEDSSDFGFFNKDIKYWMPLPTPPSSASSSSPAHPSEQEPDQRQRSCTGDEA